MYHYFLKKQRKDWILAAVHRETRPSGANENWKTHRIVMIQKFENVWLQKQFDPSRNKLDNCFTKKCHSTTLVVTKHGEPVKGCNKSLGVR